MAKPAASWQDAQVVLRAREDARAAKDWKRADELRAELTEMGWEVRDEDDKSLMRPIRYWLNEPQTIQSATG